MKHPISTLIFLLALALAYSFVLQTGKALPALSAVHFDGAGNANGFMPRERYIHFMSWLGLGLPLLIVAVTSVAYARADYFKVPNREYWMAPERADATRSFLIGHGIWFGTLLTGLLCFVHWIVVIANRERPPHLANGLAIGGLLVFTAVTLGWAMLLLVVFRRPR
jgi:hypothetical protein